jgi:hypothetical protein
MESWGLETVFLKARLHTYCIGLGRAIIVVGLAESLRLCIASQASKIVQDKRHFWRWCFRQHRSHKDWIPRRYL